MTSLSTKLRIMLWIQLALVTIGEADSITYSNSGEIQLSNEGKICSKVRNNFLTWNAIRVWYLQRIA